MLNAILNDKRYIYIYIDSTANSTGIFEVCVNLVHFSQLCFITVTFLKCFLFNKEVQIDESLSFVCDAVSCE